MCDAAVRKCECGCLDVGLIKAGRGARHPLVLSLLFAGCSKAPSDPGDTDRQALAADRDGGFASSIVSLEREKARAAAHKVKACGFQHVEVGETPQDNAKRRTYTLDVYPQVAASQKQFSCALRVGRGSGFDLILFPGWSHEAKRFYARAWLDSRGLLSRLPTYHRGGSDLAFAHWTLCAAPRRAMLSNKGTATLRSMLMRFRPKRNARIVRIKRLNRPACHSRGLNDHVISGRISSATLDVTAGRVRCSRQFNQLSVRARNEQGTLGCA